MAETSPGRLSRFARVMHPAFHSPAAVQHAEHMRHGEGQLALAVSDVRFSVVAGLPGRAGSMPARRRWAPESGRRTVESGRRTVESGRRTVRLRDADRVAADSRVRGDGTKT